MDDLSVKSEIKRNVAVVAVAGRVDSVTATIMEEQLAKIARENNKMILDLNGMTYLSSAGVRAIVKILQSTQKAGGGVKLANVSIAVSRVLETVGMLHLLQVFPSVDEAIATF